MQSSNHDQLVPELQTLLQEHTMVGIFLASAIENKVAKLFASITVSNDDSKKTLAQTLFTLSAREAIRFEQFDAKFVRLLDQLLPMSDRIVWYKGLGLARSLYSTPEHRLCSDFDLIISPEHLRQLGVLLGQSGYEPFLIDDGFCNQFGVGPTSTLEDLFLLPDSAFSPSAVLGFKNGNEPMIDLKINPLDRGMKMIETDRFYQECLDLHWKGRIMKVPGLIDHLIISLVHLEKDRFSGWKWLYDVHLLVKEIDREQLWDEFLRRCRVEGIRFVAWSGLSLTKERFCSSVPDIVLKDLAPNDTLFNRLSIYSQNPLFLWNTSSFPMLLLNAYSTNDTQRKLAALRNSFLPGNDFLRSYYDPQNTRWSPVFAMLFLHWLTLILPGGFVRRTFGRLIWPTRPFSLGVQTNYHQQI